LYPFINQSARSKSDATNEQDYLHMNMGDCRK